MASEDRFPQHTLANLNDVSTEILAKIFSTGTVTWREEYPDKLPFPLLVCGVSLGWKFLALSMPDLWTFVIPPLHLFKTAQSSEHWTSQWLSRSGVLSVSIVIDDRLRTMANHTVQESQAIILGVLRGIGPHSHRLRRLDIWSQHVYPNDLNTLFQHPEEPMRLRQLSLCCWRITQTQIIPNSSSQTAVMFSWLERLPRLHKLRLAGAIFPVVSPLTYLSVHGLCARYSEIQTIFTTCPNIRSLVLPDLLPTALPLPSQSAPITATSLKSVAVNFKRVPHLDLPYPIVFLHMPNIEYLEIDGDIEISRAFDSSLTSSKVQRLRLTNRSKGFSKDDQTLLRSFNRLRNLQLIDTKTDGLLAVTNGSPSMGRKRSISSLFSFSSSSSSSSATLPLDNCWPLLMEITLSTIFADDVVRLCRYVNINRGIQTVWLSKSARRHLSESLIRDQDVVHLKDPCWKCKGMPSKFIEDVDDWLNNLTNIRVFKTSHGLLDREQYPLQEL